MTGDEVRVFSASVRSEKLMEFGGREKGEKTRLEGGGSGRKKSKLHQK